MAHANMSQRIDNGIGNCLWRTHSWRFTYALGQDVTILIERDLFVHRRRKPLGQTAMNLSLHHHGVDDCAAVVYRHKATNMYLTRATVDIYDTDVASERLGEIGRIVVVHRFQARLQVWRTVGIGGKGQFLDGLALAW